jgi:predicted MFS family arabinose efflux permease
MRMAAEAQFEESGRNMHSADRPGTRLATRLAFFVAGFGVSSWAPLVPLAKKRLNVNDGELGLILLCLGVGSICAMLLTGALSPKYGSKPLILVGCIGLTAVLPLLTLVSTPLSLGICLGVFGASLGALDVAANIHAIEVERAARIPLMSGFHAHYSVGGLAGSALMTALISTRLTAAGSGLICSGLMLAATGLIWPRLLSHAAHRAAPRSAPLSAIPRGIVMLIASLVGILFLVEGAVLDWGALLLTTGGRVPMTQAGVGYIVFSIAMTGGRFCGDFVVARLGDRAALFWGSLLAIAGIITAAAAPFRLVAVSGFFIIGLGASNAVPVLFRRGGSQKAMPVSLAVTAITTVGYAGILIGPAVIGLVAGRIGLRTAFGLLAALVVLVTLSARRVTRNA